MDVKFIDKLLKCFDCREEFVFTAGEQLFFCDKQFKNDPKRCKPCKAKRGGVIPKAGTGAFGTLQRRTETRTRCSACSIETTVPFKPTQGRPVLCRECFQAKARLSLPPATVVTQPSHLVHAQAAALTALSEDSHGAALTANAAVLAASSMVTAHAHSSVATAADLASVMGTPTADNPEIRSIAPEHIKHLEMIPIGVVEPTRTDTSAAQELLALDPETVWA